MSAAPLLEIVCDEGAWEKAALDFEALFSRLGTCVAQRLLPWCDAPWYVSVLLTDDAGIRPLNLEYRNKDKATNVLSFGVLETPVSEDAWMSHTFPGVPFFLGDIVLAFETVTREATEEDKPLVHHVAHLFVHGMLHLLGYDHETQDEAHIMEALEIEILAGIGIPNPYILDTTLCEGK